MIGESRETAELRREMAAWRNRFLRLLDRSPTPTAISRTDGALMIANPAFATLWGLGPGQIRQRNLLDLLVPTDEDALLRATEGLRHGRRSRYPVHVAWDFRGTRGTGRLTVEAVGDEVVSPALLLAFLHVDPVPRGEEPMPALTPTPQEARILALVASGATSALIARSVGLTADGVNYHLTRLCRVLRVPNRTALVAKAYALGLLRPACWPPASQEGR
ncbi:LuxR C-terminal-related transcriptional regulator [Streptomyces sp. NPDC002574]|uniref:LuxR C-terminal-related transcriptional regulator n=1 Tax=Streptomyces sp. NPDC002574 TaxID=3364652 RepID=UPI0036BA6927